MGLLSGLSRRFGQAQQGLGHGMMGVVSDPFPRGSPFPEGVERFAQGMINGGVDRELNAIKQEALRFVRDPRAAQQVMAAQTPEEIQSIVQQAVSRSRSRMTEGGF
jgi:hypothetical protein